MGLQDKLERSLNFFLRGKLNKPNVFIHRPNGNNLFQYCVVIRGEYEGRTVRSSSSSSSLHLAFLKALGELGESILCINYSLENRSGIAGGLFRKNSIRRAKAELIERDAFLYHYRKKVPFHFISSDGMSNTYRLASADSEYNVSLVLMENYLKDLSTCLVFGMGCDVSLKGAVNRAYSEFSSMYLNHKIKSCEPQDFNNMSLWSRKTDFHHNESRHIANKEIFSFLCFGVGGEDRCEYDKSLWRIEDLVSPIRFFHFVKASHPQLEQLEFGHQEVFSGYSTPVFHPFW